MSINWTDSQLDIINKHDGQTIVSASAGTGKTSVIIERALRIVQSGQANIDELLIATFTEDAAEELKTRFRKRLMRELAENPDSERISRQINLIDQAQISTINGLCLKIMRENYHLLGISDKINLILPERASLMKNRIVEELFEDKFADGGEAGEVFREIVRKYGGRVDRDIKDFVLSLHEFLCSLAWPEQWIEEVHELNATIRSENFKITDLPAWKVLRDHYISLLNRLCQETEVHLQTVSQHNNQKLQNYLITLKETFSLRLQLLQAEKMEALVKHLHEKLPRSPSVRTSSPDIEWWGPIKKQLDGVKALHGGFSKALAEIYHPDAIKILQHQTVMVEAVVALTNEFAARLKAEKERENVFEFNDFERLTLTLLAGGEYPEITSSEVAQRYQEKFRFVLVDEYQDINELQDIILRLIANQDHHKNLFMVGDVKQSIYRFRLAEPEIFQNLCSRQDNLITRFNLPDNFRSRHEVIDIVNQIFQSILTGGALEITYDQSSQLRCKATFPEGRHAAELHVLAQKLDDDLLGGDHDELAIRRAIEREAWFTAHRIKKLLSENTQFHPEDIVILLRSVKAVAGKYISSLRSLGLNAHCEHIADFLEFPEIRDMVALLRIIENPFQDIPLASVMRSPLFGFTVEELSQVRLRQQGYLFFALSTSDDPKCMEFVKQLNDWRESASYLTVAELIRKIYLDTSYPDFAGLKESDSTAKDNLNQFHQLALQFSDISQSDLTDFLEYLELSADQKKPLSATSTPAGRGIRIMSIHSSKGLEFPVVVIGNLGKKINFADSSGKILFDKHLLLGCKEINNADPDGDGTETLQHLVIKTKKKNQAIAEELRLLYVAMTRAREKLIMVGNFDLDKLNNSDSSQYNTLLQWIVSADAPGLEVSKHDTEAHISWTIGQKTKNATSNEQKGAESLFGDKNRTAPQNAESVNKILEQINWQYPNISSIHKPVKFSVTELTKHDGVFEEGRDSRDRAESVIMEDIQWPEDRNEIAIKRGIAWHKVMEKLDLSHMPDIAHIESQISDILPPEEVSLINTQHILNFFASKPGRVMLANANNVKRELPFTFALPPGATPDEASLNEANEPILLQGIIDSLVVTDDGLVIIDYKTSNIDASGVEEKRRRYQTQIQLYARAASAILGRRVHSVWLYFNVPNSAVQVI